MIVEVVGAVIHDGAGRILTVRKRRTQRFMLPGGKREPGESDVETLAREVAEELLVRIDAATARHAGTFTAQAHGHSEGVEVRMTCYTVEYEGTPRANAEIAEVRWLTYADRARVSPVDQLIFDHLHEAGDLS